MLYYEVTILEEPEHTKEQFEEIASKVLKELEANVGKVYVCDVVDANGNLVDAKACGYTQEYLEDEYTQQDFEFDKREWEFAREIHNPREIKRLIAVKNLKELEEKIAALIEWEKRNIEDLNVQIGIRFPRKYQVLEKRKVGWKELVDVELKYMQEQLFRRYLNMKLKPRKMNYEKYQELRERYFNDDKYKFEMLLYINKMLEAETRLGRNDPRLSKTPLKEMSAKEFVERVKFLADGEEDENDLYQKLNKFNNHIL